MSQKLTDTDTSSITKCGYAVCSFYPNCCKQIKSCPNRKEEKKPLDQLQFYRSLDKYERLGPEGVKLLLTIGRLDESGDFTEGCGLGDAQADCVLHFLASKGKTNEETLFKISRWFYIMTMPKEELDVLYETLDKLGMIDE